MSRFVRLWTASTLSNLGDGVMIAAFPLLAASVSSDPRAVAAMTAAATAPWLLFGLVAGVVVDRVDRVRLMWIVDLGRALALAGMGLLVVNGQVGLVTLYAVVFILGVAETLFDSAAMAILPAIVDTGSLERANGRLFAGQLATNQFIGPPLGALLFGVGAALPAGLDAITFLMSAALLVRMRVDRRPASPESRSIGSELREGLGWLWGQPDIRAMAVGAGVLNLAQTGALSVLVLFATKDLGMSDLGFGTLFAVSAGGALTGSLTAGPVTRVLGRRSTLIVSVAAMALSLLVIGLIPLQVVTFAGMLVMGLAIELWNVVAVSHRQHATPDRLRGRVMSAYRFIAYGSYPIGALLGGWTAAVSGISTSFIAGGILILGLSVYLSRALGPLD
jgi:MFS family permease